MTRITDDFIRNFEQSAVMPTSDKDKVEEKAKAQGKGDLGATSSVTVETTAQPTTGSSSIPVVLVPPPTMNPNEVMAQVQSLTSKMSTNQMSASSNQLATDHSKMTKAIKEYNDRIKKEHEEEHKSHSKGLVGKIIDGVEDAVEVTAGVALLFVPGAQIAGAALLATAAINITDQVVTGAFGNKPLLTGKDAEIFNYCALGASVVVGIATMGAGLAASGAAVAGEAASEGAEAIEMTEMTAETAESTTSVTEDVSDTADIAEDVGDNTEVSDETEEVDDGGDETGDEDVDDSRDVQRTERERTSTMQRMEESFEKSFEEDVVEDTGDPSDGSGDGDGDDGSTRVPRRDLAIAGMKIGARTVKGVLGIVQAAGGVAKGVNTIEIGKAMEKAQQYEADAAAAQKDINVATLDMKQTIGSLQNEIQQYEALNKGLTGVIMSYAQVQTDTAVQGYA